MFPLARGELLNGIEPVVIIARKAQETNDVFYRSVLHSCTSATARSENRQPACRDFILLSVGPLLRPGGSGKRGLPAICKLPGINETCPLARRSAFPALPTKEPRASGT